MDYTQLIIMIAACAVLYFVMIRSDKKKKNNIAQMRNELSLGDEITTIGGMVGKVCGVDGDLVTFETGEDRVRIQVQKWGISTKAGFDPKAKK